MNTTTTATAKLMTRLAEAETLLTAARREEARTAGNAERAAVRVTLRRADLVEARRNLRTAERTGTGVKAAARRVATCEGRLAGFMESARTCREEATAARRAARTAARRVDSLSLRAARAASRTVGKIAERLGKTTLATAPAADRTLPAEELPAVTEVEARADEFAELDAKAKAYAKQADAVKKWLRQLPVGVFGRVTVTRTAGGTVIDGDQVAIDYLDAGLGVPPRKGRKDTFKVLVAAAEAPAAPAAAPVLTVAA